MWRGVVALTGSRGLVEPFADVDVVDVTQPVDLARRLHDEEQPVLVASHPVHAHATRLACTLLAAHRPDLPIAHVSFPQAPLAAVLAMTTALELTRDAGHGAAVWRDVSDATWSGAVVPGVAKLAHPSPRLHQHVRSLLPGARYLVRLHPDATAIGRQHVRAAMAPLGRGAVDVHATGVGPADRLVDDVITEAAPRDVVRHDLPGAWQAVFGRPEDSQLALVPVDVQQHLRPRGGPCRSCGLSTIDPVCVFCRLRVRAEPGDPRTSDLDPAAPAARVTVTERTA